MALPHTKKKRRAASKHAGSRRHHNRAMKMVRHHRRRHHNPAGYRWGDIVALGGGGLAGRFFGSEVLHEIIYEDGVVFIGNLRAVGNH